MCVFCIYNVICIQARLTGYSAVYHLGFILVASSEISDLYSYTPSDTQYKSTRRPLCTVRRWYRKFGTLVIILDSQAEIVLYAERKGNLYSQR